MTDIVEQLRDQSLQLARRSFDSVDAGLAANVADAAIDEIERLRLALEFIASVQGPFLESTAYMMQHKAREALALPPSHPGPAENTGGNQS